MFELHVGARFGRRQRSTAAFLLIKLQSIRFHPRNVRTIHTKDKLLLPGDVIGKTARGEIGRNTQEPGCSPICFETTMDGRLRSTIFEASRTRDVPTVDGLTMMDG